MSKFALRLVDGMFAIVEIPEEFVEQDNKDFEAALTSLEAHKSQECPGLKEE